MLRPYLKKGFVPLSLAEKAELQDSFTRMDADQVGAVSQEQFHHALQTDRRLCQLLSRSWRHMKAAWVRC